MTFWGYNLIHNRISKRPVVLEHHKWDVVQRVAGGEVREITAARLFRVLWVTVIS